ncbi:MAG: alpha/beta hydrolase [Pseudomonadota bacterium]
MPEVTIPGPAGRLEARYHHNTDPTSPVAIILHPHPQLGGTMNNQIVYNLYYTYVQRGFSVMRFNFRGVGRSQGLFDNGPGELSDAAAVLDWAQTYNADARYCWVAGVSYGAWIGMQLLMRRPEIAGFISVAPMSDRYDFTFLAPCPSSGLIINGSEDRVTPPDATTELVAKLKTQKGIVVQHTVVDGANHFFEDKIPELMGEMETYLDMRLEDLERQRGG